MLLVCVLCPPSPHHTCLSFDRDEPIGAGAGDFVEEGDDEMAEEFQVPSLRRHCAVMLFCVALMT